MSKQETSTKAPASGPFTACSSHAASGELAGTFALEQVDKGRMNGGDMTKTKAKAKRTEAHTHLNVMGQKHKGHEFDCIVCHWKGPKSMCACGHPGDGDNSAHGGSIGHG